MLIDLGHVPLVEHVVQALVDVGRVDENDGAALGHRVLHSVDLADEKELRLVVRVTGAEEHGGAGLDKPRRKQQRQRAPVAGQQHQVPRRAVAKVAVDQLSHVWQHLRRLRLKASSEGRLQDLLQQRALAAERTAQRDCEHARRQFASRLLRQRLSQQLDQLIIISHANKVSTILRSVDLVIRERQGLQPLH